jgi:hypothetical protein
MLEVECRMKIAELFPFALMSTRLFITIIEFE